MRTATAILVTLAMALTCLSVVPEETEAARPGNGMAGRSVILVPLDQPTIQDAVDAAANGDRIMVAAGEWYGAIVDKAVEIRGEEGAVIVDGPAHSREFLHFGFRLGYGLGGSGATISHFTFECVKADPGNPGLAFPVFASGADDVTVSHCTMYNPLQGITNWKGNGWTIEHNTIVDLCSLNGGGIGIFVGDYSGGVVKDNLVSHNSISGTLMVSPSDGGGYEGSGVVLYADFRWGCAGAQEISGNEISFNRISLVSDDPDTVDVCAIELTDSRADPDLEPVIFDNTVVKNDCRGSANGIVLTPQDLGEYNAIDSNRV